MKNLFKSTMIVALAMISLQSCKKDDDVTPGVEVVTPADLVGKFKAPATAATEQAVITNYIDMMYNGYNDSYEAAKKLDDKLKAFVNSPSEATHKAAKAEWVLARDVYGQTEVFRGSNGPVDTEGDIANEGAMNAWPLDEALIDYVAKKTGDTGTFTKSLIEDASVTLDAATLEGKNEEGGDKNVSIGWHAIEFLLWGQDNTAPTEKKAGLRSFTDYTTEANFERRGAYLKVVSTILVADLKKLVETTKVGGAFRTKFLALDKKVALSNIISGPCFLAAAELSQERMNTPANSDLGIAGALGQEDEHSCFSDNTHRDVYMNAKGIINVILGEYNTTKGASFFNLVQAKDADQAEKLEKAIVNMWISIIAIDKAAKDGTPFDLMILNEGDDNPGPVLAGDKALKALGNVIKESATKVGAEAKDDNA